LSSGITIGHPVGFAGARIIVTLMGEMLRREYGWCFGALCIGGAKGMAIDSQTNSQNIF
jgi:acetyl-CoA C-acetyltransferase